MGLKLDVKFNWLVDKTSLTQKVKDSLKGVRQNYANVGRAFNKDYFGLPTSRRINEDIKSLSKYGDVFVSTFNKIKRMNQKGELAYLIGTMFDREGRQTTRLNPSQMFRYALTQTENKIRQMQLDDELFEKYAKESPEEKSKADWEKLKESEGLEKEQLASSASRWKNFVEPYGKAVSKEINDIVDKYNKSDKVTDKLGDLLAKAIESSSAEWSESLAEDEKERKAAEKKQQKISAEYWNGKIKYEKDQERKDEKFKRNALNAFFMRWGKLGVGGFIAGQVIRVATKIARLVYETSMQGLDWRRTISGGASGGNWFGQDIAAYQRAGLGANQIQGFKRGLQSYLGQVKLGMGNAAPLMMLGLSALDNPDVMEKQIERSLRRFPKDVSLALAQQMGLDYNMWEAIYNGRLDRTKSAYSEDAMQKWAAVADTLNDLLTSLKVFGFEKFAGIVYGGLRPKDTFANASFIDRLLMSNPLTFSTGYAHAAQNVTINVNTNGSGYQQGEEIGKGCRDALMQMRS